MKKYAKLFSLLSVMAIVTGCNGTETPPALLGLDLSDACLIFNGNNCTGVHDEQLASTHTNTEGLTMGMFHLYKTDSNGVTRRVHCKTKRSNDDKYYTSEDFFAEMQDISDDYFFIDLGRWSGKNKYFINKRTGDALKFPDNYDFSLGDYGWVRSLTTLDFFPQDAAGNIYGCVRERGNKTRTNVVAKFTITDKGVKGETIAQVNDINPNLFAVDKDGNVAYNSGIGNYYIVTADGEKLRQESQDKIFFTGYDGHIYSLNQGVVRKIVYDKDTKQVTTTVMRNFSGMSNSAATFDKILFLDGLKQIYTYTTGGNKELMLYQLYGETAINEPIVISAEDMGMPEDKNNEYGLYCDNDSLVDITYDGEYGVTKIDVKDNMKITKYSLPVDYDDGMRMLADKKMAIFYWNAGNEINCPGNGSAYMSVGIYDLNTGTLSKQDSFITGNADRTNVINLKSIKQ